jgi:hypothetical protein
MVQPATISLEQSRHDRESRGCGDDECEQHGARETEQGERDRKNNAQEAFHRDDAGVGGGTPRARQHSPDGELHSIGRLIVAAFSIQLLLNSGTLLARGFADGDDAALAGQILACLSIARIPVFAYQVLQILYLPRLASQWKTGAFDAVRTTLFVAGSAAIAVGAAVVGGMVLLGGWVTALLFGPDLVLSTAGIALVSSGVAIFIVALVMSDGAVALGSHTLVVRSWVVALLCAVPVAVVADDLLLRVTLPFIVGSLAALVQLLIGIGRRYRTRSHRSSHG